MLTICDAFLLAKLADSPIEVDALFRSFPIKKNGERVHRSTTPVATGDLLELVIPTSTIHLIIEADGIHRDQHYPYRPLPRKPKTH